MESRRCFSHGSYDPMGNMYSLLRVDSTCQPIITISCSKPLILVSSSLSFWQQPARILTRETRLGSCTNVSRNKTQFKKPQCMKKPRAEGKIIFFCFQKLGFRKKLQKQWLPRGRRKRLGIDNSPAIAPFQSKLILRIPMRLD